MGMTLASDADNRRALAAELQAMNFAVHQPEDPPLFTDAPERAADIAAGLDRIGEMIKLEQGSVRRTLRLTNPGVEYGTTPTLWASIQYILPGEIATAHRHTPGALRFIMKGTGANTIVDGEQYQMNEGDLVLTPGWTFHDHQHNGSEPMVWLDVLDINLVRSMNATFFEDLNAPRQAVNSHQDASHREFGSGLMRPAKARHARYENPVLPYPAALCEAAVRQAAELDPDPYDDTAMIYTNPTTGGHAMKTIGTMLQRLRPGFSGQAHRHVGSSVYYVIRGEGRTTVNDELFNWVAGDFLAIPSWARHAHANRSSDNDCLMFHVNDFPALEALGLWHESGE